MEFKRGNIPIKALEIGKYRKIPYPTEEVWNAQDTGLYVVYGKTHSFNDVPQMQFLLVHFDRNRFLAGEWKDTIEEAISIKNFIGRTEAPTFLGVSKPSRVLVQWIKRVEMEETGLKDLSWGHGLLDFDIKD